MSDLLSRRRRLMGEGAPLFYDPPLNIVRGQGATLWDAEGRSYIDCYNNVAHVGHAHPQVVRAVADQMAQLATHSRYLHKGVLDYIDRLTGLFSHDLSQMILTCTGSEANDIALRIAEAVTGKSGIIVTDSTYHGNTLATAPLAEGRTTLGHRGAHIRYVPAPESVSGFGADIAAERFARDVASAIADLEDNGPGFAGILLCPIFANEGLPDVPAGYLDQALGIVRRARGLVIADEVQPGFGRLGSHLWGHDWAGIEPDVVTLGKPMGNGYPVAGVVTRPDLLAAFHDAFRYFNTFGGNPVAAAAGMAVLDVMETESLMARAVQSGARLKAGLEALKGPGLVEVRARGLFLGLKLEDADRAARVVNRMKDAGVLIGRMGPEGDVLKLRPPLVITEQQADKVIAALADALAVDP